MNFKTFLLKLLSESDNLYSPTCVDLMSSYDWPVWPIDTESCLPPADCCGPLPAMPPVPPAFFADEEVDTVGCGMLNIGVEK